MQRTAVRHLTAIGLYIVAAAILTWPLVFRLSTHVPGDGIDNPALAWNLWWIKARLVDQLSPSIFNVDWMFYPININLAFYTLTPLNGLISLPLQTAFQLIVASNLILLSSFVLGAYGTFLLALYIQCRPQFTAGHKRTQTTATDTWNRLVLISLVAGLIYGFASAKLFYSALGQFNIASSQWIPFAVLFIVRLGDSGTQRAALHNGALAGLFIVMQAWAELTFASFLLLFFVLYALWWAVIQVLYRTGKDRTGKDFESTTFAPARWFVSGLGIAAIVFIVGLSPFLAAMIPDMLREGDFFGSGGGFADIFSADLMGYLVPTLLHPIFGNFTAQLAFPNDKGQHIYLGYTLLILCVIGVYGYGLRRTVRRRGNLVWFWLFSATVFWLLTLGPQIRWAGNELPIPGPFAIVSRLPFFSGNRYPSRYSVMLLICASALSVYGLRTIAERMVAARASGTQTRGAVMVVVTSIAALLVFEHLSVPQPLTDFRVPSIYATIAADPGNFSVLELPTGWRNGARVLGKSDVLIMMQQWYQTEHGKRRLGGNTSRNPPYKFQYFTEVPLIGDLIALMNADRDHIAAVVEPNFDTMAANASEAAPDVFDFLGAKYLVLHVEHAPESLIKLVEEALPVELLDTWHGTDWAGAPSTIRLYKIQLPAARTEWDIDIAAPEGRLHLAEGWSNLNADDSPFRFATRPQSVLLLDIPEQGGTLHVELADFASKVNLNLNGQPLTSRPAATSGWIEVSIPAKVANQVVDRLTINWLGDPVPVTEIRSTPFDAKRIIGDTGVSLEPKVSIAARGAGEEVGDFAHIYIDGIDYAPNLRGYNLVAAKTDGTMLDAQAFDTHASLAASEELAVWLEQWPAGTVIAGAAADDASHSLQAIAVDALNKIGVEEDLRDKFRWGHAFVGVVGAAPGTALEQAQLLSPSDVSIGPPVDAPSTTGGVGKVRFSVPD